MYRSKKRQFESMIQRNDKFVDLNYESVDETSGKKLVKK